MTQSLINSSAFNNILYFVFILFLNSITTEGMLQCTEQSRALPSFQVPLKMKSLSGTTPPFI